MNAKKQPDYMGFTPNDTDAYINERFKRKYGRLPATIKRNGGAALAGERRI